MPLACLAARHYTPNRLTYTLARGSISLLRSAPELIVALFLILAYGFGKSPRGTQAADRLLLVHAKLASDGVQILPREFSGIRRPADPHER
ncbi:phosphonate ABC transporter, permease protein PhnE [Cupriavidus necator]|uniref:Phosphonate ABC transporter, permease protein PhnE n=2 Tax=Cupriavidus necator TaxID=106590 RepID=A0A1U9UYP2_CUPNE|nr:phosphonate ABC transporter, permease protein PhnE [Cupriavidus necator]